jgi:hypothetical protein
MNPYGSGIPGWFIALLVFMGVMLVIAIASAIWKSSVLRSGGLNPLIAREQLEAKLYRSQLAAPPAAGKPIEQRLAELEDLHERGVISNAELAAARAKIIAGG